VLEYELRDEREKKEKKYLLPVKSQAESSKKEEGQK
jgi:hypothetical protein